MRNKKAAAMFGVAAVALVGGTFAYFTQTSVIDNPFDTGKYSTVVTEDFKPEDGKDWEPGVEINKDLYVHNTGDRDVVVRVKFEDIWTRETEGETEGEKEEKQFKYVDGQNSSTVNQEDQYDGEVDADQSVVHKYFENKEKWSDLQPDGYYYYLSPLAPNTNTGTFLSSVKLLDTVDMGKIRTKFYYTNNETKPEIKEEMAGWTLYSDKDGKTEFMPGEGKIEIPKDAGVTYTAAVTKPVKDEDGKSLLGYSDADYTLRITIETVQATDKAVKDAFDSDKGYDDSIYNGWNLKKEALETAADETPAETLPDETGEATE